MGYETKLIIGTEYLGGPERDGSQLVMEVCRVDLSKAGSSTHTGRLLSEARKSSQHYSFFAEDGSLIAEDRYGDKLTAVDIHKLLEALGKDSREEPYRRFELAISMLAPFLSQTTWPDTVRCVQYGH